MAHLHCVSERRIYFAGSISAGREDAGIYSQIIKMLAPYGTVLTEHIGDEELSQGGEAARGVPDKVVHDRDLDWLASSHAVVAEVTVPSLGVGYEIGKAEEWNKDVLCLHRPALEHKPLSSMLSGSEELTCRAYSQLDELPAILDEFFSQLGEPLPVWRLRQIPTIEGAVQLATVEADVAVVAAEHDLGLERTVDDLGPLRITALDFAGQGRFHLTTHEDSPGSLTIWGRPEQITLLDALLDALKLSTHLVDLAAEV